MSNKELRVRRARRFRARNRQQDIPRLVVHKTLKNIYAQIIVRDDKDSFVKTSASTLEKKLMAKVSGTKSEKAEVIGKEIAQRAKKAGVEKVAFDRSGFKYHGRLKALADAARKEGLDF